MSGNVFVIPTADPSGATSSYAPQGPANERRPACRNHGRGEAHSPITLENIARAVIAESRAPEVDLDQLDTKLYQFARVPGAVCIMSRVAEAWGCQFGRAKSSTR